MISSSGEDKVDVDVVDDWEDNVDVDIGPDEFEDEAEIVVVNDDDEKEN